MLLTTIFSIRDQWKKLLPCKDTGVHLSIIWNLWCPYIDWDWSINRSALKCNFCFALSERLQMEKSSCRYTCNFSAVWFRGRTDSLQSLCNVNRSPEGKVEPPPPQPQQQSWPVVLQILCQSHKSSYAGLQAPGQIPDCSSACAEPSTTLFCTVALLLKSSPIFSSWRLFMKVVADSRILYKRPFTCWLLWGHCMWLCQFTVLVMSYYCGYTIY